MLDNVDYETLSALFPTLYPPRPRVDMPEKTAKPEVNIKAVQAYNMRLQEITDAEKAAKKFIELMRGEKISWQISDERMLNGDIELKGTDEGTVKRYQEFLDATPKLKAALILSVAVHDPERLEALEMSAARRWCDGYSDSLLSVILANLGACNDGR